MTVSHDISPDEELVGLFLGLRSQLITEAEGLLRQRKSEVDQTMIETGSTSHMHTSLYIRARADLDLMTSTSFPGGAVTFLGVGRWLVGPIV